METHDFRKYLQAEFAERNGKNNRYSLRSFAKRLGTDAGTLSRLLSGKKEFTSALVRKFGGSLSIEPKRLDVFLSNLHLLASSTSLAASHKSMEIAYDTFSVISDCHHYAILELTHTKGFQNSALWISKRLGISKVDCWASIERLQRLGFLEQDQNGIWKDKFRNTTHDLDPNATTLAQKKHQEQILDLSKEALQEIPRTERDHLSNIVAYDPEDLPEIKRRIRDFRKELMTFLQREAATPSEVGTLSIAYFPLTKTENNELKINENKNTGEKNENAK